VFTVATAPLIGKFVGPFHAYIKTKPRETAVKQEIERLEEGQKAVIKVGLEIQKRYPEGLGPAWSDFWTMIRNEHAPLLRAVDDDGRDTR
jgi:cullin-associated NEDD8-dissociated protein 1